MNPIELIVAERARQIAVEGWTQEHDDEHNEGEMAAAAAVYALPKKKRSMVTMSDPRGGGIDDYSRSDSSVRVPRLWPWDLRWWKPTPNDRIRELVKAGALIVAEIERLQRKETSR